jgi:hypothetical protein
LPRLTDWASTLVGVLGIDLPEAEGLNLAQAAILQLAG